MAHFGHKYAVECSLSRNKSSLSRNKSSLSRNKSTLLMWQQFKRIGQQSSWPCVPAHILSQTSCWWRTTAFTWLTTNSEEARVLDCESNAQIANKHNHDEEQTHVQTYPNTKHHQTILRLLPHKNDAKTALTISSNFQFLQNPTNNYYINRFNSRASSWQRRGPWISMGCPAVGDSHPKMRHEVIYVTRRHTS